MSGSCCEKEASLLGCSQSSSTHSAKEGKERCNDFSVETEDVSSSADLVLILFTGYETDCTLMVLQIGASDFLRTDGSMLLSEIVSVLDKHALVDVDGAHDQLLSNRLHPSEDIVSLLCVTGRFCIDTDGDEMASPYFVAQGSFIPYP